MSNHRTLLALALPVVLAAFGCTDTNATGPDPDPEPEPDVIHNVLVRFDSITVRGSCDHNSIFESPNDGEFTLGASVRLGTASTISSANHFTVSGLTGTYQERVYVLGSSALTTFPRNITKGERFSVVFTATERDGLLGNDPALDNKSGQLVYEYRNNAWSSTSGTRVIQLQGGGSPDLCGVRLLYTISSVEQ